jgi:hypothetical protein
MSLRIRVSPPPITGLRLVDLAVRALHDVVQAIVQDVRREVVVRDVELADGVATIVPHALGYPYAHIAVSPVRGASTSGRIAEGVPARRDRAVVLTASGFGGTVTVDLRIT